MIDMPERDVPPCDPVHPGRGFFAVWELSGIHRRHADGHVGTRRMAIPLGAYAFPETAMILAQWEAVIVGGFFRTVLVTDPFGCVVGQYSMTTMAKNPNPGKQMPAGMRHPEMIFGATSLDGIDRLRAEVEEASA